MDLRDIMVVWLSTLVATQMAYDEDFGATELALGARPSAADILHALHEPIESHEMFPDKPANAGVLGDSFEDTIGAFVAGSWTKSGGIIKERNGVFGYLVFEDVGDISLENGDRVTPSHWNSGDAESTERGLEGGKVVAIGM
jgi:hypothetical protein